MSTIVDVANLARVSTATVSRVINTPDQVSPATRDKVLKAMETCQYRYNALAKGFATQKTRIIGVVVPSITNPVFAESTRGIQDVLSACGYHTILGNTDYTYAREAETLQVFRQMQVEGIIISTTDLKGEALAALNREDFPFVLTYSTVRSGPLSCVGVDNFAGGYRATAHLTANGHTRIAMLAGAFSFSDKSRHRWYGYRKCLRDNKLSYDAALVLQSDYTLEGGMAGLDRLMALDHPPTAVFCSNDYLALGIMEKARHLSLSIPRDLSLVGFDDIPMVGFLTPGLDTIHQPAYDMGQESARVLVSRLKDGPGRPVHKLLPTQLIKRGSVQPPTGTPREIPCNHN
jgi:LacI family transcriptional regulator